MIRYQKIRNRKNMVKLLKEAMIAIDNIIRNDYN